MSHGRGIGFDGGFQKKPQDGGRGCPSHALPPPPPPTPTMGNPDQCQKNFAVIHFVYLVPRKFDLLANVFLLQSNKKFHYAKKSSALRVMSLIIHLFAFFCYETKYLNTEYYFPQQQKQQKQSVALSVLYLFIFERQRKFPININFFFSLSIIFLILYNVYY